VTSYTLRKGAADKTKADVVVVGVVRTPKGLRAAPGGEGVASAFGRKFAPLLSTIGFTAKPGEVTKVPTGGTIKSPLLILVGLGDASGVDASAVRRAAGVAIRAVSNAASVAVALPALDDQQVRAVVEGTMLGFRFPSYAEGIEVGGYHLHFISADRSRGGHVLESRSGELRVRIDPSDDLHVELPPRVELEDLELAAETHAAVEAVERGHSN